MSPIWQEILPRDGFIILYIVLVLEWSDNLIISYPEKIGHFLLERGLLEFRASGLLNARPHFKGNSPLVM
jgi:hypothetical protein